MTCLISVLFCLSCFVVCGLGIWGVFLFITSHGFLTAPTVSSSGLVKEALLTDISHYLARVTKPQTIMDLGCGYGTLLMPLAKRFPHHHFVGYEWGFLPFYIARLRTKKTPNITLYRRDFFTADIRNANIIILFLIPFLMERIEQKCVSEAKKNTLVYAIRFPLPNTKPMREIKQGSAFNTVYIYKTRG